MKYTVSLLEQFNGVLLGALIGDCHGAFYEGKCTTIPFKIIGERLDTIIHPSYKKTLQFTDDSQMTMSICKSLIQQKSLKLSHMGKMFATDFFTNRHRGYGANVGRVFQQMKEDNFENIMKPASLQFDGSGSSGNGGAMRVSPMALFCYDQSISDLHEAVSMVTRLTHTHPHGIIGAQLQASAVYHLLHATHPENLLAILTEEVDELEGADSHLKHEVTYANQMRTVERLLRQRGTSFNPEKVVDNLGNDILAIHSVPTAIYLFLRAQKTIDGVPYESVMMRCLFLAASIGGDVDTIGSMACALAGAQEGVSQHIPPRVISVCEANDTMTTFSEQLYEMVFPMRT